MENIMNLLCVQLLLVQNIYVLVTKTKQTFHKRPIFL